MVRPFGGLIGGVQSSAGIFQERQQVIDNRAAELLGNRLGLVAQLYLHGGGLRPYAALRIRARTQEDINFGERLIDKLGGSRLWRRRLVQRKISQDLEKRVFRV